MPTNRLDRPIILGVVGDSATGKTTLSNGIAEILGVDRMLVLCTDDYHMYSRAQRAEKGISALDPEGNYLDILEQDLAQLRRGNPILKPVYDHVNGTLERPEYVEPKPYIIVEGLLGYSTRKMRDCYDVKLYLDPEDQLRVEWKVHRDTVKRGYSRDQVLGSLEKRHQDSINFIHPQRTFSDVVVRFQQPVGGKGNGDYRHLDVRQILRPTLPHPDVRPILDGRGANAGFHLELSRDNDGKPVDILAIDGNISDEHANNLEDLLWKHIPEAGHLRGQSRGDVGAIDASRDGRVLSHPLALTQLLIAYHMVKAAVGEYAV